MGKRAETRTGGALWKGAAILGAAAVVSKLLGTLQKIPLQNIAGDGVFGIYNAVYPLYILILTLAAAGFPIAVSKFVSEHAAKGDMRGAGRVLRTAAWVLALTGLAFFAALYAGAEAIASAIGLQASAPAIRSVSFALLIAPVMAALRGYFQGLQEMVPTAVSQVVEQTVRVGVMLALLFWLMARGSGAAAVAAGATFGSAAGAVAGFAVMLWFWLRHRQQGRGRGREQGQEQVQGHERSASVGAGAAVESTASLIRRFAAYAIPICLGTIAMPVLTIVDAFTVPRLLAEGGMTEEEAAFGFGVYNHGLPLVQLVTMVATSMAAALVPSVADAVARGDREALRSRTEPVLRLTWLVGLGAAFGLAVTAAPMNVMFYTSAEGWPAMSILAFTALFATLLVVTGSMLQGLGAVMTPAWCLFAAAGIKAAGNLLLVPAWGINGAAAAAVAAYAAAAALSLRALRKRARIGLAPPRAARLAAAVACMSLAALAVAWGLPEALRHLLPPGLLHARLRGTAAALAAVAAGAAVYGAALLRFGAVTAAELRLIPGFDRRWKPLLVKLRLLRP